MLFKFNHIVKLFWPLSLIIYFWLGWKPCCAEDSPEIQEYQVKATFLLKFSKFVTYPDSAFDGPNSLMNICVLGDDPFQGSLDVLVKNEQIRGRSINVMYLRDLGKVSGCHTLFVSSSEQRQLINILAYVNHRSILTVSDMEDFVTRGGMIQFYRLKNMVRFLIDPVTAREANLTLSSQLLQLAKAMKKP